jgi:hypothetical protein
MDDQSSSSEQFCAAPVSMFEDGAEMVCVRRTDGQAARLSAAQANALIGIGDMKPLDDHISLLCERDMGQFVQRVATRFHLSPTAGRRFANTLKAWRESGTLKTYGRLAQRRARELMELRSLGLLFSDQEILNKLTSADAGRDPEVRIRYLAIPTANRPDRLALCLQSFVKNLEKYQRQDATVLVIEDGEDARNKEVAKSIAAHSQIRVEHYGLQHRTEMIEALVRRSGVAREVVEFGLALPKILKTPMPARNALTLMTLGGYLLQTDDDTRCAYVPGDGQSDATFISSTNEPCEGWFYADHESILRERPLQEDLDALGIHEELLGKSAASAVRQASKLGWRHVTPELLISMHNGPGIVGITSTGCAGDSGLYASGSYLITCTEQTMARICKDGQSYDTAVHSGKVLRVPVEKILSRGDYFQGMSYATDNTRLQPPCFPMGRNADGVSALLYLLSDSQSFIAHLPWAIYHHSDTGRKSYFVDHTEQFSRVRLSDILIYALRSAAPPLPAERSQSMACMGEQLAALGDLPAKSFKSYVRGEFVRVQTSTLKYIEEKLASHPGKYPQWERDVRTMCANIKRSISQEDSIVPLDVEAETGGASALEFARQSIAMYGRLMCGWAELVSEARNMQRQAA